MTSGISLTNIVPSGRNIQSNSTMTSPRWHLQTRISLKYIDFHLVELIACFHLHDSTYISIHSLKLNGGFSAKMKTWTRWHFYYHRLCITTNTLALDLRESSKYIYTGSNSDQWSFRLARELYLYQRYGIFKVKRTSSKRK